MALFDVYHSPIVIRYKTSYCTKASFIYLFAVILTVVSPLLIAYKSQGLWLREVTIRQQPEVKFKHEALLIVDTSEGSVAWSSSPTFNSLLGDLLRVPVIKSSEFDVDHDGLQDNINIEIELPLHSQEFVYGFTTIFIFDYRIHTSSSNVILEGAGVVQYSSGIAISSVQGVGDLVVDQRVPLPPVGLHTIYNTSILPLYSTQPEDWKMHSILSKYWERNITTKVDNLYLSPERGASPSFLIELQLKYPLQVLTYIPRFWQVIKYAWVQYLAILVIFLYAMEPLKRWVFFNQVVRTWVEHPRVKTS